MIEMSRTLGATGIPTTAISLGLAALGRPGYLNLGHGGDFDERSVQAMAGRTQEVLDAGHAAGVRHFDAARSYGLAEEFLGQWLRARSIEPGALTISSKWGYTYTADWEVDADPPEVKDLSAATLRRQLAETRKQLGEHLTLYQIHSATASSGVLDPSKRRLRKRCGKAANSRPVSLAGLPEATSTASTCKAAISPSPVVT